MVIFSRDDTWHHMVIFSRDDTWIDCFEPAAQTATQRAAATLRMRFCDPILNFEPASAREREVADLDPAQYPSHH